MSNDIAILAATRTTIDSFQGSLAGIPASDLGAALIRCVRDKPDLAAEQDRGKALAFER